MAKPNPEKVVKPKAKVISPEQAAKRIPGVVTHSCCRDHKNTKGMVSWNVRRGDNNPGCPGEHY